jgi:16S rRNA (adenine1518-N6/adenine1519-N6)-dimethyltransferase
VKGPRAKRRLGQHFLSDPRILARIAAATGAGQGDTVLEIGPGPGGLTAALVKLGARVVAIEKDPDVLPGLRTRAPGALVIEADALEIDWHAAVGAPSRWFVAGNIPYNITSPLIDKALTPPRPASVVFLVQKEVALRVGAAPGTADYGALSVGVQAVATAERLFNVPAGAFSPAPRVDSAVLRLVPLADPLITDGERAGFRAAVVGLFGFRRKQLLRAVRELTGWDADQARAVLDGASADHTIRPEAVSPAEFVVLFRRLVDAGWQPH